MTRRGESPQYNAACEFRIFMRCISNHSKGGLWKDIRSKMSEIRAMNLTETRRSLMIAQHFFNRDDLFTNLPHDCAAMIHECVCYAIRKFLSPHYLQTCLHEECGETFEKSVQAFLVPYDTKVPFAFGYEVPNGVGSGAIMAKRLLSHVARRVKLPLSSTNLSWQLTHCVDTLMPTTHSISVQNMNSVTDTLQTWMNELPSITQL